MVATHPMQTPLEEILVDDPMDSPLAAVLIEDLNGSQYLLERLTTYIRPRIKNVADAEELAQETYLRILSSSPSYKGPINEHTRAEDDNIARWVITICKNICIDYYKRKTIPNLTDATARLERDNPGINPMERYQIWNPGQMSPPPGIKEKIIDLYEKIAALPSRFVKILYLAAKGLTLTEIAASLEMKRGTVSSTYSEGIVELTKAMQ